MAHLATALGRGFAALGTVGRVVAVALVGGVLVAVVASGTASAGPLGKLKGQSLDVTSDRVMIDLARSRATLTGKVKARLGEVEVDCAKVEIGYSDAPEIQWIQGSGGVVVRFRGFQARSEGFRVEVAQRRLDLEGAVRITRGQGWLQARRASVDLASSQVTLDEVRGVVPVASASSSASAR